MARVHKPARRLRADPRKGKTKRSVKTDREHTPDETVREPVKLDVEVSVPDWLRDEVGPKDDPEELDEHEA